MTDTPSMPAGWYPAPHANNEQRYWDGERWLDWTPEQAAEAHASQSAAVGGAEAAAPAGVATLTAEQPPAKRKGLRWWAWLLIALGALLLLIIVIGSVNAGGRDNDRAPAAQSEVEETDEAEPTVAPVEEDTTVEVPDMVGMTVSEAVTALERINITLELPEEVGGDWVVTEQSVRGGDRIEPGDPLSISAEPDWTLAQQNAVAKAQSYLEFSGFSRAGLIDQLEYEGFSTDEARFGVDNSGADWMEEAAEKAASYLETSSFSRQGLADQLAFEEFTPEQIAFALESVGY